MNPVKHFKKKNFIGTFVSEERSGKVLFGWSKYNTKKETMVGVPFCKKNGRAEATNSLKDQIVINTAAGFIQKGDIKVYDRKMTEAAVDFVKRMNRYFRKSPDNVVIVLGLKYLNRLLVDIHNANKELESTNSKLLKERSELKNENLEFRKILNILKDQMIEFNV